MRDVMEGSFSAHLDRFTGFSELRAQGIQLIQANLGPRCNLECRHCHLAASPRREEEMHWETMEQILALVEAGGYPMVDITGGAPEMHPHFRPFVVELGRRGVTVQVRTNLTLLLEPEMEGMAEFFHAQRVHVVGSMPCYLEQNVDAQRGEGVYQQSIAALRRLNQLGYGREPDLPLILVYNPAGPTLPPAQCRLEEDYRRILSDRHGLYFTRLLTIANMPIGRFRADLSRQGREAVYGALLREAFNPATLNGLMCRHQLCIGWDGLFYDCDFNLALRLPVYSDPANSIQNDDLERLAQREIVTGAHCFACTAGSGSSCQGALVA